MDGNGVSLLARYPAVPRHLLTVEDYHRMGEAGILSEDDRVELIEGELVEMAPIGSEQTGCWALRQMPRQSSAMLTRRSRARWRRSMALSCRISMASLASIKVRTLPGSSSKRVITAPP